MEVVGRQEDRAGGQGAGVAEGEQGLDRGGQPALHVGRPAAGEAVAVDRRRHERQVDGVEVAVELEDPAGPAAFEPGHDGRGVGVAGLGTIDREPFLGQDRRQGVGRRPPPGRSGSGRRSGARRSRAGVGDRRAPSGARPSPRGFRGLRWDRSRAHVGSLLLGRLTSSAVR